MRLEEIAWRLNAVCQAAPAMDAEITGVASPATASATELVFAENEAALTAACAGAAGAILTTRLLGERKPCKPVLMVDQPRLAFARAARMLRAAAPSTGFHGTAIVDAAATLGEGVSVGPGAVIEAGASIGAGTTIAAGVVVGNGVRIGTDCHLYPRVVLYPGTTIGDRVVVHAGAVLGADGFGYVRDRTTGEYTQFPQQGTLVVEDDVEVGANCTIDRGALEETRIGRGTKLDNLVHVGHNVVIGANVVIAAQTGISGSSVIGEGAVVGGQVGVADHVVVGRGVILGAQAGLPTGKRVAGPGVVMWGTPARPLKEYLRELATLGRLARRERASGAK